MLQLRFAIGRGGPLRHAAGQVRGEQLDEIVHIAPQKDPAPEAQAGDAMVEQVAGVNGNQVGVQFRVVGHGGHDAHAHAQSDIGLDHIGVGGSEHDLGLEAGAVKGLIQLRAPGEPENIGHDGIIGYVAELKAAAKEGQGVARWRDDAAVPVVAGHHDQVIEQLQSLRGNGELDGAGGG